MPGRAGNLCDNVPSIQALEAVEEQRLGYPLTETEMGLAKLDCMWVRVKGKSACGVEETVTDDQRF